MSVNVYLKNQLRRLRRPIPFDFGKLRVKGRNVLGNIVTKNQVERIARIMPIATEQPSDDAPATEATEPSETTIPVPPVDEAPVSDSPAPPILPADDNHEQMGFDF